jgi:acyl-CoA synthetase (NDP forming)
METVKTARQLMEQAKVLGRRTLDEPTSKQVLKEYGIHSPQSLVIHVNEDITTALQKLSLPVVLKLVSPDVLHKSDFGGVALGLSTVDAIQSAMDDMTKRCRENGYKIEGFLLEEMAAKGHEIVIGGYCDETFGPVIMFGLGGIFVEVLQDVTFRICPITKVDAREMIHELRGHALLKGARGGVSVSDYVLIDTLLAVGGENGLFFELKDIIKELDINPLLAREKGVIALDARIVLAEN